VDPEAFVWQLSVCEQQRVEIVKSLDLGASLIILDEPTAVLTPQEVADLFHTLKRMVAEGHSLLFISHKLHEVLEVSDRVTVLRDGVTVGTTQTADTSREELVKMMVGRDLKTYDYTNRGRGEVGLRIMDLHVQGDRGEEIVRGVDLEVHRGEILGLAGVSGNGQRELAEALSGMRPSDSGSVEVEGRNLTHAGLNERVRAGLSFIPEERMRDGAIGEFTVEENVFLRDHESHDFRRWIFLKFSEMARHATNLVESFAVKTPTLDTPLKNLSGGNIQKLILARELSRNPHVLIAAQPTRGVDIGATEYIHTKLTEQCDAGTATLLISEDLDEILKLADRIAVIFNGRIVGIMDRSEATQERVGMLMAGYS
jgi:simple sugar transport system ATP-binding protein